jgi:hypothetical protein
VILLSSSLILFSSIQCQEKSSQVKNFSLSDFYKKQKITYSDIASDTIIYCGYELIFNSIDSNEYFSTLDNYYQFLNYPGIEMYVPKDKNYQNIALEKDLLISYKDSTFILKTNDSILYIPKYQRGSVDGLGSLTITDYFGFISELNLFVFWVSGYEGGEFFAINKNTHERIRLNGIPKYSPNQKMILSSYYDIEIGFYSNGFELYNYKNDTFEMVLSYYGEYHWGFEGMIWKNDNTFYFIRISLDSNKNPQVQRTYQSLKFNKIASH